MTAYQEPPRAKVERRWVRVALVFLPISSRTLMSMMSLLAQDFPDRVLQVDEGEPENGDALEVGYWTEVRP